LEQDDVCHDFHEKLIPAIAERLVVQVPPNYIVKIDEHIYSAGFWPIGLRDCLPSIPIPLREPDRAATLDLRAVLHHVYDASGYEDYIYTGNPDPALSPADRAWAEALIGDSA
jgi:hypothetical protein